MTDSNLENRVSTLEQQINEVLDELDLISTIQRGMRVEARETSQAAARLERTVRQLAEISARTQAVVLRQQDTIERQQGDIEQYRADMRQAQENINRILDYLENPNRGDTMPN